ncbi:hypothetical protein L1049_019058 [Liquidambar formosana]|uniref:Uncharacterized protein n=1 Tax=Liquidambar formosana TaxID=63359 RepID=A0AAP0RAW9_LIQFO
MGGGSAEVLSESENLLANGLEGVARVRVDEMRLVLEENDRGGGVGGGDWVRFGAVDAVDLWVHSFHPPQHVVEGAVFHDQNHNCLDGASKSWVVR